MKQVAPLRIISFIAIAMYLFFGFYLLVQENVFAGMPAVMQKAFGILLIAYGGFRLWLVIQRMRYDKNKNRTDEEAN